MEVSYLKLEKHANEKAEAGIEPILGWFFEQ
jgi:hypothetical protein